jgi:hypothetical protein
VFKLYFNPFQVGDLLGIGLPGLGDTAVFVILNSMSLT